LGQIAFTRRAGLINERMMFKMPSKGKPNRRSDHRDTEVGRRVRTQRLSKGMSQTELGTKIGVTFQQVQKYENGVNRIGAGRLSRIAEVLEVPVTFFFPDDNGASSFPLDEGDSPFALLSTSGAIQLVRAYSRIRDGRKRHSLVEIAEHLADAGGHQVRKSRKG
jgi:transcriptional regulator with XRE-family HTH domain